MRSIRKLSGSDEIQFDDIEIDNKLRFKDEASFTIPVQMPGAAGDFTLKLGFFGNKGTVTGEPIELTFSVKNFTGNPEGSAI